MSAYGGALSTGLRVAPGDRAILPKRLGEALVGVALAQAVPDAHLWASRFYPEDGFGIAPDSALLLLQCSWGTAGPRGISTHVNRAMIENYLASPELRAWGSHIQFVLFGHPFGTDPAAALGARSLWAIEVQGLADFLGWQGRGTVNGRGLTELKAAGLARPLLDVLTDWSAGALSARSYSSPAPAGRAAPIDHRMPFDPGRPTPIGLVL